MLNNHNIILLFSDFYNILSFSWLLLMRKSFYHEVIKYFFQDSVKKYLGSGSESGFRFLAGSGFYEYGSETLVFGQIPYLAFSQGGGSALIIFGS